jgi:hypothetical protein
MPYRDRRAAATNALEPKPRKRLAARILATILVIATPLPEPVLASDGAVHDGSHDFDFNIGTWTTHIRRFVNPFVPADGTIDLQGTVTIRPVWGGKAQLEEIEADGPKGHWEGLTLFLYNPRSHQWSQTFTNSVVARVGTSCNIGEFRDGRGVLYGADTFSGRAVLIRAVWSNITAAKHHYEESFSDDGGATWVLSFSADLTKKAP